MLSTSDREESHFLDETPDRSYRSGEVTFRALADNIPHGRLILEPSDPEMPLPNIYADVVAASNICFPVDGQATDHSEASQRS